MAETPVERLARLRRFYQERVDAHDAEHPGYATAWADFQAVLLGHGGEAVVPPAEPDPMLGAFVRDGVVTHPAAVVGVPRNANDCHVNTVALWRSGQLEAIGTGYGLTDDLWREHSWGWDSKGRLVETTEPRERYFGVRLTGSRAAWFADWIDPPP